MDNLPLSTGAGGATAATDQDPVSGAHYQIVKLAYGALDTFTLVTGSAGLPVAQQGGWSVSLGAALPAGANTIGAVNLAQYTPASGRLPVDGSGVTQPVSGTVTAN